MEDFRKIGTRLGGYEIKLPQALLDEIKQQREDQIMELLYDLEDEATLDEIVVKLWSKWGEVCSRAAVRTSLCRMIKKGLIGTYKDEAKRIYYKIYPMV